MVSEFKRRRIANDEEPVEFDPTSIRSSDTYISASNEGFEIQKLTYDLHELSHPRNLWTSCAGNVELSIEASQLSFGRKCLCKPPFRVPSDQLFGKGRRQGVMCAICSGHQLQVYSPLNYLRDPQDVSMVMCSCDPPDVTLEATVDNGVIDFVRHRGFLFKKCGNPTC